MISRNNPVPNKTENYKQDYKGGLATLSVCVIQKQPLKEKRPLLKKEQKEKEMGAEHLQDVQHTTRFVCKYTKV